MKTDHNLIINRDLYSFDNPFLALNYEDAFYDVNPNIYTQGCKWAPDGSKCIVATNDWKIRVFEIPKNIANGELSDEQWLVEGWRRDIVPLRIMKETDLIYDFQWSNSSVSCVATSRNVPAHVWSTTTGELVGSYSFYNHLDELTSAYSVNYSLDGSKVMTGFNKHIQVFDTLRPGRISSGIPAKEHLGIVSSITPHPLLENMFAAGSYNGSIGVFSLKTNKILASFVGHQRGVTHVKFSNDGLKLFSGTRKDDDIVCWDIRNLGKVLNVYRRMKTTNQRIYFDITPDDRYLVSGSTDGHVLVWDLRSTLDVENSDEIPCTTSFSAHRDCVNGVSCHPFLPILATCSGQRRVPEVVDADEETAAVKTHSKETSLKLWWLSEIK